MALSPHALTTLETIKSELGITDNNLDSYLERQINVASEKIERFCNRHFEKRDVTVELEPVWGLELVLPDYPINSITSVMINDQEVTDYKIDLDTGILWRENGWEPEYLRIDLGQDPEKTGQKIITVTYNTGYVLPKDETVENPRDLPYELEGYCIEAVKAEYFRKDLNPNIESEKLQSYSVVYDKKISSQVGLPLTVINGLLQNGWVKYS